MRTFPKYGQTSTSFNHFSVLLLFYWSWLSSQAVALRTANSASVQSKYAQHVEDYFPANSLAFARLENRDGRRLDRRQGYMTREQKIGDIRNFSSHTKKLEKRRRDSQRTEPQKDVNGSFFSKIQNATTDIKLREILNVLTSEEKHLENEACHMPWVKSDVWNAKFQPLKSYGTLYDSTLSGENRNRRHVSDISDDARSSAIYFPGHATLRWSSGGKSTVMHQNYSSDSFTAEIWILPEGGQQNPAIIMEAQEEVHQPRESKCVWTLGISTLGDRNAVFYFSVTDARGHARTIFSKQSYKPEAWVHVSVASVSDTIQLFVDAVQVAVLHERRSRFHSSSRNCSVLILGGSGSSYYRGVLDKLMVWKTARSQAEIREDMYNFDASNRPNTLLIKESFENYEQSWRSEGILEKVFQTTPNEHSRLHFPEFFAPPCGQTICDNPDIIQSYTENWTLRKPKTLRYNVVSINENDGSNPMATLDDVVRQNLLLLEVFEKHNITWMPTVMNINNSSLKHKTIGCEPTKIGNRQCNRECMHARLGHDGGDCDVDESVCDARKKGDGHCDSECNKIYHAWDLGDCCDPSHTDTDQTCFDPASIHRAYLSITEYKKLVAADNSKQLSVLFANWTNPNSIGISTFPWDKHTFTPQGGTVVQLKSYTTREEMSGLIHELGHNLGLLHVHHGAHAIGCDDICAEWKASMTTGDLCEDTNPTPMNTRCGEPAEEDGICGVFNFTKTPYDNFMSYADGSCQNNFTPQQRARMHCYIDMVYGSWAEKLGPAPIPLAPKVVRSSYAERTVTLTWPPPIDGKVVGGRRTCDPRCNADGSLKQFATKASSPDASGPSAWSPDQATGPPDQEPCTLRGVHFWMPSGGGNEDCGTNCYIDLEFADAFVPALIRIWVTYGAEDGLGVKRIVLHHDDQTATSVASVHGYCDIPLSVRLKTKMKTKLVRVYVHHPYTAIDAVEIISEESNPLCAGCRNVKYRIHRDPPFPDGIEHATEQLVYTDATCEEGISYSYAVEPILGSWHGEISPAASYRLGQTFCGDGQVQKLNDDKLHEDCDDGNMDDGDGCSSSCKLETGFNCKGQPSLCYWYEGDGNCEDFEQLLSRDCLLPPEGYTDFWAIKASTSSEAVEALVSSNGRMNCPSKDNTLGPADSTCTPLGSFKNREQTTSWSPCVVPSLTTETRGDHWIKMVYGEPVRPVFIVIYFATNQSAEAVIQDFVLILPGEDSILLAAINTSCAASPATINLPEKDRMPVKDVIIKFSSKDVAIDAVALRSKFERESLNGDRLDSQTCSSDMVSDANVTCYYKGTPASPTTALRNETECIVRCRAGYLPNSAQKIVCRDGMWEGKTSCTPVSCGKPSHVKFASFNCPSGYGWNAVCNFTCLDRTRKVGSQSTSRCDENGTWTVPGASCQNECSVPPKIGFAFSSCSASSRRASRPGDTCKYRCKTGYHVTQPPLMKRTFRLTCGEDGKWKGPGCQPVVCPNIHTKFKGIYKCTRGIMFGSYCTTSCQKDLSVVTEVIRCESDGRWNSTFSKCPSPDAACQPPLAIPGVEITCRGGYGIGQTCKAMCNMRGRKRPDIVTAAEVSPVKTLMDDPDRKTRVIVCNGNGWFPNPQLLKCVVECDRHATGNGRCDRRNNRAHCDWDGGDCCKSTTNRQNISVSACAGGCRCKDTNAIENSPTVREEVQHLSEKTENGNKYKAMLLPLNAAKSVEMTVAPSTKSTFVEALDSKDQNALDHKGEEDIVSEENFSKPREKKKSRRGSRKRGRNKGHKKSGGSSSSSKRKRRRKMKPERRGSKRKNRKSKRMRRSKRRRSQG